MCACLVLLVLFWFFLHIENHARTVCGQSEDLHVNIAVDISRKSLWWLWILV